MASLLARGAALPDALRRSLERLSLAVAYTRSAELAGNLGALIEEVIVHDPQPPPGSGHASAWLASALGPLGLDSRADPPPCQPSPDEEAEASPWIDRLPPGFLAIHPGSGSPSKNWPAGSFAALVEAVEPRASWLLVEGPAEDAWASPLRRQRGAVVAAGLSPRTLGAILRHAGVYVGNDSGVSHLAAAWGAPTVALFGPTEPQVWAPVGPRVRTLKSPSAAMSDLSIDTVLAAAGEISTSKTLEPR
jgi:ADP-heptose:LPS heptosyltransferase